MKKTGIKMLSFLLALVLLAGSAPLSGDGIALLADWAKGLGALTANAATDAALGDVDGSGDLSAADARLALRAAVGLENYANGSREFLAADADKSGDLSAADARLILRAAVGLEVLTPSKQNSEKATYTISNEVIVDDENCTFRISKVEIDNTWGFTLKVFCENKTADKTLRFTIDNVSVNGYMVNSFWTEEVGAGKKSNDKITFSSSSFEEIGISSADEIVFSLRIYDSNDWSADDFVNDSFTIYPTGLNPDTIKYSERRTSATEQVVVDNKNVCFVILETGNDRYGDYTLHCYLENKTEKTLMFSWRDVSINGFMINPSWAKELPSGKRSYSEICFLKSELEKNGITTIEELEYRLCIYNSDDWSADNVVNDIYRIYPTGLNPDTIKYSERRTSATEQVVVDNKNVCFVILETGNDRYGDYTLHCYLENKTEKTLMFSWRDVSINEFMINPSWATELPPGKRSYSEISFLKSELEENGITAVEEIEYCLHVYDSDDWSADAFVDDTFRVYPTGS